jgi:tRNA U38,U39,U40 pseudouridine synthase TruA
MLEQYDDYFYDIFYGTKVIVNGLFSTITWIDRFYLWYDEIDKQWICLKQTKKNNHFNDKNNNDFKKYIYGLKKFNTKDMLYKLPNDLFIIKYCILNNNVTIDENDYDKIEIIIQQFMDNKDFTNFSEYDIKRLELRLIEFSKDPNVFIDY